jgi:L-ascorbate metabolism protein UlaG (beta-lactamase superfamily)
MGFSYKDAFISWYGHDSFYLKLGDHTIWVDPYQLGEGVPSSELVLITHDHFDHYSVEDIERVANAETIIVAPFALELEGRTVQRLPVAESMVLGRLQVTATAAYNTDKFKEPDEPFHPKGEERCGYLIHWQGLSIYHAGDSDRIPEMKGLNPDVALLPVSGTYVMTAEEAAGALEDLKPEVAIPMHYGAVVGNESDAHKFKELAPEGVRVEILSKQA